MATLTGLVDRVRLEIGDPGKSFVWQIAATGASRYELPYSPIDALSAVVFSGNTDVSDHVTVEEHTGVITFDTGYIPDPDVQITVQGVYFRFFTNAELTSITDAAVKEHLYLRTDAFGRGMTVGNLPPVEEFPAALLGSIQALYTLATDAAFDIDISTPDGVSIPRSERYRQLMDLVNQRKVQYDDLCKALNIGLTRIDVFTLRRISKATNRYVPIYIPQEVDDRMPPQRVYISIPTYGGQPVPQNSGQYDMVFTQGDTFEIILDFPFPLTGYTPKAQMRLYPGSAAVIAEFAIEIIDEAAGRVKLSLTPAQTTRTPLKAMWDAQLTGPDPSEYTETYLSGMVFCKRQITQDTAPPSSLDWSPTGWETWP